jgi:hypothetical protein
MNRMPRIILIPKPSFRQEPLHLDRQTDCPGKLLVAHYHSICAGECRLGRPAPTSTRHRLCATLRDVAKRFAATELQENSFATPHRSGRASSGKPQPAMMPSMRPAAVVTIVAGLLVSGCAGHSFDCITGNSANGCAPGTIGHQQMVQEQQGEETATVIDDARCRSIAAPGSAGYLACRRHAADVRKSTQAR